VVKRLSLLGPVGHRRSIDSFNANILATFLEPVVSHRSETVATLAAKFLRWELNVEPSICSKDNIARDTSLVEGSIVGKQTHLVVLAFLVLVPLDFLVPVIEVCEGPVSCRAVVNHVDLNSVARAVAPVRRSLTVDDQQQER
jgi:hypothetical protein